MTTIAMATTGQEPSRGRKFSILENVVSLWDRFLLGRACPKPCVSIGVIVVLYVFHDAASHYDDGKQCSQSEVTQNCVKNRSCKPCCQSENCCPAISHYDTPLCYNLVSMLTGLSIPYSLAKDHGYMPELSFFPAYVRTDCVRTYAAIDPKRKI